MGDFPNEPTLASHIPSIENDSSKQNIGNKSEHHPLNARRSNRSLDDFLEAAYKSSTGRHKWRYWSIILVCGLAISSDSAAILAMSFILSDGSFTSEILHDNPQRGGIPAASIFLGMLLGGLFVGTLADSYGRRPVLLSGLCINAISGTLCALSLDIYVFSTLRCLAGVGIGATIPATFTLVSELAPPSRRGFFVSLCATFWMCGSIYTAIMAWYVFERWEGDSSPWRVFVLVCTIASSVVGAGLCWAIVPESPRFLACRMIRGGRILASEDRYGEALGVANWLAKQMGYTDTELTLEEIEYSFPCQQHTTSEQLRSQQDDGIDSSGSDNHLNRARSWGTSINFAIEEFIVSIRKLYSPRIRHTTLPLQLVWFTINFGTYGLVTWINILFREVHLRNMYFNDTLFAVSSVPGAILTLIYMDKLPRLKVLVASFTASAVSLIAFAVFAFSSYPPGIVLSACAFQSFNFAAWNTVDCMTSEVFPTTIRSTGLGICSASGRVGAIIAQLINGVLITRPVCLLSVASLTLLVGALTPCYLPRQSDFTGRPVNDYISALDGNDYGDTNDNNETHDTMTLSNIDVHTPLICSKNDN